MDLKITKAKNKDFSFREFMIRQPTKGGTDGATDTFIKILKKGEKEQAIITKDRLPSDEVTIGKSAITF